LTLDRVEQISAQLITWAEDAPPQAIADQLDPVLALERWLRKRKMAGPMQTAARHMERAIGRHLGPPVRGRPRKKSSTIDISLHEDEHTDRTLKEQFRLLAKWWDEIVGRLPLTRAAALKIARSRERGLPPGTETAEIFHTSCAGLVDIIGPESVDVIVTDPPYQPEYLDCYTELSLTAEKLLRPGGQCWAMAGHRLLPDVISRLSEGLSYYWTVAYLTPGGQSVQIWDRKVNVFWKPVLVYAKAGKEPDRWFGDVARSDVNDNDSDAHPDGWAQSDSGLIDLIGRASEPGWVICDPFLGSGSTAVAAAQLGRRFVGSDIDADRVDQARHRLEA
jgi:site-specific DNA-methyltransferase (adenine-specific)